MADRMQYFEVMEGLPYFRLMEARIERKTATDMRYASEIDTKLYGKRTCPICKGQIVKDNRVDRFVYSTPRYYNECQKTFAHTMCVKQLADLMRIRSNYKRHGKTKYSSVAVRRTNNGWTRKRKTETEQ